MTRININAKKANPSKSDGKSLYKNCPECEEPFKSLIPHLKKVHEWDVDEIFDFKRSKPFEGDDEGDDQVKQSEQEWSTRHLLNLLEHDQRKDVDAGDEEMRADDDEREEEGEKEEEWRYGARKVSNEELEVSATVRRGLDRALLMRALTDLNVAIGDSYKRAEQDILKIASDVHRMRIRSGGRDVIDGPRVDIIKQIRDVLVPSCEKIREFTLHELRYVSDVLNTELLLTL